MTSELEIHVFGQGFGESIVLKLPCGSVVVIDCCSTELDLSSREDRLHANPTLHFLVEELRAERIALLVFSHPHEDHGRGLSHILEEFHGRIDQVCTFHGFDGAGVINYFCALRELCYRLPVERLRAEEPGSFAKELGRISELISREISSGSFHPDVPWELTGYREFSIPGEPGVRFHFLGPDQQACRDYIDGLDENLRDFVSPDGELVDGNWDPTGVNHNQICGAILVEYGRTRLLLGGDVEQAAWESIIEEQGQEGSKQPKLESHLVKVSHHGSTSGYSDELYELVRGEKEDLIAVLTPFNRQADPLPHSQGIRLVNAWASEVLTTEQQEARFAAKTPESQPPEALTLEGMDMIGDRPELLRALHPSVRYHRPGFPALEAIPLDWYEMICRDPLFLRALHPDLRRGIFRNSRGRQDAFGRECRLSFYFNDRGEELSERRHIGKFAGQLP